MEDGGGGGDIAEKGAPVLGGSMRRDDGGCVLVAAHEDLEQVLGRGRAQLVHAEILDD